MSAQHFRTLAALLVPLLAAGCQGAHAEHGPAEGHAAPAKAAPPAPSNRIPLPAAARETLGVVFAKAETRRVQRTRRIPGRVELRPGAVRSHHAPLAGPVTLSVEILQRVALGDVLGTLRPPELRANQDALHSSKHAIEEAADEVRLAEARRAEGDKTASRLGRRVKALESASARKADLESDADAARGRQTVLEAELKAARAKLERERHHFSVQLQAFAERVGEPVATLEAQDAEGRAGWEAVDAITLRAEAEGVVTALPRGLSGWAAAGEALVEVTDPEKWWFSGWALEADLAEVAAVSSATLLPAQAAPGEGYPISLRLGPTNQPAQRRVQVLGQAEAAAGTPTPVWLRAGMSVFAEIVVEGSAEAETAVPRDAVVPDGAETVVFLRDPQNRDQVIRQAVTLGASDGHWVAVLDGVAPGDEVVTAGAYALKLSSSSTQRVKGHFHADGSFHPDEG